MDIKELISKLRKGETLTTEELAFIDAFDASKMQNDAAAAARRKADADAAKANADAEALKAEIARLKAEQESGSKNKMSEIQLLQAELKRLSDVVTQQTEARTKAEADSAAVRRSNAISEAAKKHGIKLVDGVSGDIAKYALERYFGDGIDPSDETTAKLVLDKFKSENKALIADTGASRVDNNGKPIQSGGGTQKNPFAKDSWNLTEQAQIAHENPAEAASLKAQAGAV